MRISILILVIVFLSSKLGYTQVKKDAKLSHIDSVNINLSKESINFLKIDSTNENYIVYILNKNILVISKKDSIYRIDYLHSEFDFKKQRNFLIKDSCEYIKKNEILDRAFSPTFYDKSFLYSENKYIGSSYVYFLVFLNGIKETEFNLPSLTYEISNKKFSYPINKKLQSYLTNKLLKLN